ncbi:ATP-binding protein [Caballeronia sp. GAFFF2]|uniref:ATP-binding protein n=1 Tax=Caballeronia sp. GAFFF2 TaxID=2921741 RepID=UPI002027D876|nr:ATP-binding protein [Caballeronia sp. GAFFF2]
MKLYETLEGDPWHFARPALAASYLDAFDLKLSSARGLFARRRMGKTEFLQQDLLPAARERGYLVAYTNLWESRIDPDIALVSAIADALAPQGIKAVLSALGRPVRKIKAGAKLPGVLEGSLEAEIASEQSGLALREVLKQIDKQKKPLLLIIDEAQVLAHAENSDFAHALRAGLDVRKDRIKVIFAGSSETTLRAMFARASEPFYNWAALEPFPLLGQEFVDYTIKLMNSMARNRLKLEQGLYAFSELHSTPEFFKRFVERYMLYQVQGADAALSHTKAAVFSDEQFNKQWAEMNSADQAVIRLIAHGDSGVHSAAGLGRMTELLGRPVNKSTASHALRRLQQNNVVTRLSIGEYRIEDEAFAEWIRRKTTDDG